MELYTKAPSSSLVFSSNLEVPVPARLKSCIHFFYKALMPVVIIDLP